MPRIEIALPFRDNWYFDAVRSGIERRAEAAAVGTHVFVEAPGAAGRAAVAERFDVALAEDECIGAIAVGFAFVGETVPQLLAHGRPVVVVGGLCAGLPSVFVDDVGVARAATEYLLSLGHSSIAHLAGYAVAPDDFPMRRDRVRGYSEAMRAAGFDALSHVVPCEFSYDAAYRVAHELLSEPSRPTAVFAVADELAFPVLDAAHDLGLKVPRDLSVVGIDDHPDAGSRDLTTWRQDPSAIGAAAAARVLGGTESERQVLDFTFVARSSAAALGKGGSPWEVRLPRVLRRAR